MVKTGQTWSGLVVCRDSTGALATPSVGPVGALYVDGTANGAAVTISGSNPYKWTVTLPALTAGQCVSMYITATIATIATASVAAEDVADTVRLSDVPAVNVTYWAGVAAGAAPATVADLPAAAPSAATVADAVWDEVISGHLTSGTTGARLNTAASASGSGSTAYSNTVTDSASAPLDGVEVWITSDSGGAATVASTTTDTLGAFTVWLDPGTYYLWLAKGGYNFGNPTTITVS